MSKRIFGNIIKKYNKPNFFFIQIGANNERPSFISEIIER
jgi:hypothetical protein